MATKKKSKIKVLKDEVVTPMVDKIEKAQDEFESGLDPAEEKMLDKILMTIVWFIVGWLGLSVLLVLRGYVCNEIVSGAFFCAGIIN